MSTITRFTNDGQQIEVGVNNCNPLQLEAEIRAIPNFPQRGLSVYQTTWPAGLVIYAGQLSGPMITNMRNAITAHNPNFTDRNEEIERRQLLVDLRVAYQNWASLNNSQQSQALRKLIRLLIILLKQDN